MMDAKEAVKKARQYICDIFEDETIKNVGLEEIVFDDQKSEWNITIGFSRPWDFDKEKKIEIQRLSPFFDKTPNRDYKIVILSNRDGELVAVKNREVEEV